MQEEEGEEEEDEEEACVFNSYFIFYFCVPDLS